MMSGRKKDMGSGLVKITDIDKNLSAKKRENRETNLMGVEYF